MTQIRKSDQQMWMQKHQQMILVALPKKRIVFLFDPMTNTHKGTKISSHIQRNIVNFGLHSFLAIPVFYESLTIL